MSNTGRKRMEALSLVLLVVCVLFAMGSPFSLKKISDRSANYTPTRELKNEIKNSTKELSAYEIYKYSIKITARELSSSAKNYIDKGEANCVGYAQMCAGIANYAFRTNGYHCEAKPVVGFVMFCGINMCNVLKWCMPTTRWENFVKDHDFVEFYIDGETFYADASAYDLIYKDCKTIKKER